MPNPNRSWTISINNTFGTTSDQAVQYKEALLSLKQLFVAAGWTVTRSSNTVTAGASDNWNTTADIVLGLAGAGSWIVFKSPAGWVGTDFIEVLMYVNNATGDTTPQLFAVVMTPGTYSGGTTAALPTSSGVVSAIITAGDAIIAWTTYRTGRWSSWRSSRGDLMFGIKEEGLRSFNFFLILHSNVDGSEAIYGGGRGSRRCFLFANEGVSGGVLTSGSFTSTSFAAFNSAGSANVAIAGSSSVWSGAGSWADGLDAQGRSASSRIEMFQNVAANARWVGHIVDVGSAPPGVPFGILDDTEDGQVQRRVAVDDVWLYVPTASLPLR
jgi:hypothetical protein